MDRIDLPPEELVLQDLLTLHKVSVSLHMDGVSAFQLLSSIQLAMRHPNFPPSMLQYLQPIAEKLESQISITPAIRTLIRAGHDPGYDTDNSQEG